MKKLILCTLPLLFSVSVLIAQQERPYRWDTWIFENEASRINLNIPQAFPTTSPGTPDLDPTDGVQFRGFGQIVNLFLIEFLYDSVLTEQTSTHASPGFTDRDYFNQFLGAGAFTIDSLYFFAFMPQSATSPKGGTFRVFKTEIDFFGSEFTGGYRKPLSDFSQNDLLFEQHLSETELKSKFDGSSSTPITPHTFRFQPNPLTFDALESAILLYHTEDDAHTWAQAQTSGIDPWHTGIGYQEYANGGLENGVDTRRDPIGRFGGLGLVMYRQGNGTVGGDPSTDEILMASLNLIILGKSSLLNTRSVIFGSVELVSGVRYHFGKDADEQGLGQITPNPATADSRISFSLNSTAAVTLEVYTTSGEAVATLLQNDRYIPGNYSVRLPIEELMNGSYLVRMTANENVYSMKFTVAK